ncbi:ABC transporter substrate-binding protein [Desulfoferrobacter suflitae]|uniref:ABC transporter substrate-binding protein n=1 Tax=Desulfoferrobacter suflitae TaxID=2865782 RepID=UPI002164E20A|nr:ABC transporter substrate-binding protein [Desulfoferrobacter suflitae]MCK8602518.1 ABC transporter substrate-binding protein [Desulfoferrobacter suflitae]
MGFKSLAMILGVFMLFVVMPGAHAEDVVKIGIVAPLSAPGGVETGQALVDGAKIAAEELNQSGGLLGKKVELVIGDTSGVPEKGTAVMERMVTHDKVVAVGGEAHSSVTMAEMEVAHRYNIPLVISEAWADEITAKGYPEVFRLTVCNSLIYSKAAKWIKDSGFKHVAVIGENSDWGMGVIKVFKDNLMAAGVKVTSFSAERTTTDFTPQLLQLKSASPPVDFLVDGFTGAGELLMIKQAYELGLAPTKNCALLGAGMDTLYPGFWDTVGEAGVYVLSNPAGLPGIPKTETSEKFTQLFKDKFQREPDAVAMEGYDTVMVIAEAIKLSGSTASKELIDAMENKLSWLGTRGTITFSKEKNPPWAYHLWMDVPVFIIQYTEFKQDPSKAAILWPEEYATVESYIQPPK